MASRPDNNGQYVSVMELMTSQNVHNVNNGVFVDERAIPSGITENRTLIRYHIEQIGSHAKMIDLWTRMHLVAKKTKNHNVTNESKEAAVKFSCDFCLPWDSNRKAQKDAEVYCLRFAAKYNYDVDNKKQISEEKLMIMREEEYDNFRQHADGMIASARQSEAVSNAEDKEDRFRVWKNLPALPEKRNYELFDRYISLARLVAEMKHQRDGRKSCDDKQKKEVAANDKKLYELYSKLRGLLNDPEEKKTVDAELNALVDRLHKSLPKFKNVMDDDPVINKLKEEISAVRSSSKPSILFRCRNMLLKCTYKVYYDHGKNVLDLIEDELSRAEPQAKSQRLQKRDDEDEESYISDVRRAAGPVNPNDYRDLLEALEERLNSPNNKLRLTFDLINKALGKDVRQILRYFTLDITLSVEAAVQQLINLAVEAPSQNDQDFCVVLAALRNSTFVKNFIFKPLNELRWCYGYTGCARMQSASDFATDNGNSNNQATSSCTNRRVDQREMNDCLDGIKASNFHMFDEEYAAPLYSKPPLTESFERWIDELCEPSPPPPDANVPQQ